MVELEEEEKVENEEKEEKLEKELRETFTKDMNTLI